MRTILTLVFILSLVGSSCAQVQLESSKWQEDLRFLQKRIHEDYDFLFRKISKQDFDLAVEELHSAIPEMEDHEVIVGLARIVALFQYGHTSLSLGNWRGSNANGFHQLPYNLYQFSEGVYVQGVHKDYAKALGAKVLQIGDKSIEEALALIRPSVPAENDQFYKAYGIFNLGIPEVLHAQGVTKSTKEVTLKLEKEGKTFDLIFKPIQTSHFPGSYGLIQQQGDWLDARASDTTPLWLKHLDKRYFYEYLEDSKTLYVRQSQVLDESDKTIADFYAEVFDFVDKNEVDRMVIDLRLNGGGNNYKNKPVVTGLIKATKVNQPGKLYVVLGRRTFSACQNLVNELENYTEAVFVGEPTAENVNFFGDNRSEVLPNSQLSVRLSYLWWQDKDPRDSRPWTAPQLAIDLSFEDYQSNHDPVMAAILDYQWEAEPMDHIQALFMQGKMEELTVAARKYVKDPKYRYYDFEDEFNQAGYQLMNNGQVQQAMMVFQFNTELFPESANAWDSLAESFWKSGNLEKAREYYNKAISMDPEGAIGENARNMLAQMKKGHK